jgi:peptide/nickel transport system permease protein
MTDPAWTGTQGVVRALWRHPLGRIGLLGVAGTAVASLAGPLIANHDPLVPDLSTRLSPPSGEHLMGTDQLGRDVLARLLVGARISLVIALTSVGLSVVAGVAVGAVGAYYGGWVDGLIMRVVDVVLAVPRIVLLIAAIALLEPSPWSIVLLLALTQWPTPARLVRAEILTLRERDYVQAARVLGLGDGAIVFRHLLPNALSPVLVAAMLGVSHTVILEAGLSFLGLGVPLSWGTLLLAGKDQVLTGGWWLALFPGLAVAAVAVSFNLLGDGLRDILGDGIGGVR